MNIDILFKRKTPNNSINTWIFHWLPNMPLLWSFSRKYFMQKEVLFKYWNMNFPSRSSPMLRWLNLGIIETQGWISLCSGCCPVHCKMFSSIIGLYTPNASNDPPIVTTKMSPDIAKCLLGCSVYKTTCGKEQPHSVWNSGHKIYLRVLLLQDHWGVLRHVGLNVTANSALCGFWTIFFHLSGNTYPIGWCSVKIRIKNYIYWALSMFEAHSRYFKWVNLFQLLQVLQLSPLYRWRNWGNLPQVIELVGGRAGNSPRHCAFEPSSPPPHHTAPLRWSGYKHYVNGKSRTPLLITFLCMPRPLSLRLRHLQHFSRKPLCHNIFHLPSFTFHFYRFKFYPSLA